MSTNPYASAHRYNDPTCSCARCSADKAAPVVVDKALLQKLRAEINAALAEVGSRNGVDLRAGNASFDPAGVFHFKLEGSVLGAPDKDAIRYDREHELFGLPVRGTEVTLNGVAHRIVGMNSTGSKVITQVGARRYLTPTDGIAARFRKGA